MDAIRLMGLFAIIPAALFLTISFFVLLALRKPEAGGLKAFGYVIAVLLWISALLAVSSGAYTISTGRCPTMDMMQEMMKAKMHGMKGKGMPHMMQGEKQRMMREMAPE